MEHKSVQEQQPTLTLFEILNIASSGYPDDFLKDYYDQETGKINEQGSGDTLAEFIVREIADTYDPDADKEAQVAEVSRVLRNGIGNLEKVIAAIESESYVEIPIDFSPEPEITRRRAQDQWSEDSTYPRAAWRSEVANQDTQLGYRDWVLHKGEESSL
jgi:ATP-dependent helicase YprA (DUF1998 family)